MAGDIKEEIAVSCLLYNSEQDGHPAAYYGLRSPPIRKSGELVCWVVAEPSADTICRFTHETPQLGAGQ